MRYLAKIYLFVVILLYSSCQAKQAGKATKNDCEKFKTGKFLHQSQGDKHIYTIERNDSVQREILGKNGEFAEFKISWTGPCSYELTFLSQHINGLDSILESNKPLKVTVDITSVSNDTCYVLTGNGINNLPGIIYIDKK